MDTMIEDLKLIFSMVPKYSKDDLYIYPEHDSHCSNFPVSLLRIIGQDS
jgi:hypothetical protein